MDWRFAHAEESKDAMEAHTYRQTLKYEIARDLLNSRIAALSAQIKREENKSQPDRNAIDQMEERMLEVGTSISRLDVTDEAALDAVITSLGGDPTSLESIML